MVAIQLGHLDEAECIYRECRRYDLLNQLWQCSGQWKRALALARRHDRLNLKTTHYQYAKALERAAEYDAALEQYEASGAHLTEVPRMLQGAGRIRELVR